MVDRRRVTYSRMTRIPPGGYIKRIIWLRVPVEQKTLRQGPFFNKVPDNHFLMFQGPQAKSQGFDSLPTSKTAVSPPLSVGLTRSLFDSSLGCLTTVAPSRDATPQEAKLIGLVELMHASVVSRSPIPLLSVYNENGEALSLSIFVGIP